MTNELKYSDFVVARARELKMKRGKSRKKVLNITKRY